MNVEKRVWVTDVLPYSGLETTDYVEYFKCNSSNCDEHFNSLDEIADHKAALIEESKSVTGGAHSGIVLVKGPVKTQVNLPEEGHYETVSYQECSICGNIQHTHEYAEYKERTLVVDRETGTDITPVTDCDTRFPDYTGTIGSERITLYVCNNDGCYKTFKTADALDDHFKQTILEGYGHGGNTTVRFTIGEYNEELHHYEESSAGEKCIICGEDK